MKTTSAKAILIATSLLFPVCCFAQTKSKEAAAYANSGIAKLKKNDFDGAIADFNRALQFDPKLAKAYYNRGNAKRERHELIASGSVDIFRPNYEASGTNVKRSNLDDAIADYNRALQLDPKNAYAYHGRGIAKFERSDLDGAITDFNHALQLDPKNSRVYDTRGIVKISKGDLEGAIADYNHSLQLDPKNAKAFYNRGFAKIDSGDADGAIADFNRSLELNLKDTFTYSGRGAANFLARNWPAALRDFRHSCELSRSNQEYARLFIWIIRSRLGEKEAADKELAAHFDAKPRSWPSKIQGYFLGKLSENEFLAAVSPDRKIDLDQRREALLYTGMKNLLDGNKSAATEFFKKCLATGHGTVSEYAFARAELKALGQ